MSEIDVEERHVLEELRNIVRNGPIWPGDSISHQTMRECVARGWARRLPDGDVTVTAKGAAVYHRVLPLLAKGER